MIQDAPPEPFHFCYPKMFTQLLRPVGRQHQPDLFESWLSNEELRSCISRLAFEAVAKPAGWAPVFLGEVLYSIGSLVDLWLVDSWLKEILHVVFHVVSMCFNPHFPHISGGFTCLSSRHR